MATIRIRFFGPARDLTGEAELPLDVAGGTTVGRLAGILAERFPRLGAAVGMRLAVNRSYVALDRTLADGDEVAVIPPVSGGAPEPVVRLTREAIDLEAALRPLHATGHGAVVAFAGVVRPEENAGRRLSHLDYEAFEEMAVSELESIREKAVRRFGLSGAVIVHRLGRLSLNEASMVVGVAAPHRAEAFEACRWIVDAVKTDVPIWKKDVWADGSTSWVNPTCS